MVLTWTPLSNQCKQQFLLNNTTEQLIMVFFLPSRTTFGTLHSLVALELTSGSMIKMMPGVANLSTLGMTSGLNRFLTELTTNTMLNPAISLMNTLDHGGTLMLWRRDQSSDHTSHA